MKPLPALEIKAKEETQIEAIHLVSFVEEQVIHHTNAGKSLMQNVTSAISLDMRLLYARTNFQMREADAQIAEKDDEDRIFMATCFSTKSSSECWLIDSGCTNHMTYDRTLFKDLQSTEITKDRKSTRLNSSHSTLSRMPSSA